MCDALKQEKQLLKDENAENVKVVTDMQVNFGTLRSNLDRLEESLEEQVVRNAALEQSLEESRELNGLLNNQLEVGWLASYSVIKLESIYKVYFYRLSTWLGYSLSTSLQWFWEKYLFKRRKLTVIINTKHIVAGSLKVVYKWILYEYSRIYGDTDRAESILTLFTQDNYRLIRDNDFFWMSMLLHEDYMITMIWAIMIAW